MSAADRFRNAADKYQETVDQWRREMLRPQVAKTTRETRIEKLLAECLPLIVKAELGSSTSPELRLLIEKIKEEL